MKKEVDGFTILILILLLGFWTGYLYSSSSRNDHEVKKTPQTVAVAEEKEVFAEVDLSNAKVYNGTPLRLSNFPKDDDIIVPGDYTLTVVATVEPTPDKSKFLMKETKLKITQPVYFKNIYLEKITNVPLSEMGSTKWGFKILAITKCE
ncbi:hypothetical protein OGZ51_01735 [Lactococcus lactis]|uniref:Uncharacterized protein n=1 Tax=Lactococcus lactis TaxID=1358 RepID=A0A9X4NF43_9LACT|nr:hypothetical protein [Lactococcus lactis]MDG4982871.1 hypothetical protein [Lactococcus lactis]